MIIMPGIMRGRRTGGFGAYLDFLLSQFRTTVPGTQTGTFQETHVYTGGTKWLLKANGFLGSTTAPQEPVVYDTNGNRLGILLEPAATNSCLQSVLMASTWTPNGATYSASPNDGPIAGNKLARFTETATTTGHGAYHNSAITVTAANWTYSIYVREGTRRYILLDLTGTSGGNHLWAVFDMQTKTVSDPVAAEGSGGWVAISEKIEHVAGDIYRLSITGTLSATTVLPVFYGNDVPTLSTYVGWTGYLGVTGVYIEGGCSQVELGSVATSYIPTTTASVTRTADVCLMPTDVVNPAQGTLYLESTANANGVDYASLYDRTAGTTANALWIYTSGAGPNQMQVRDASGTSQGYAIAGMTAAIGALSRAAALYALNDVRLYVNGLGGAVDNAVTPMPTIFNTARIGGSAFSGGAGTSNAIYKKLQVFSTRLTDGEASAFTSTGVAPKQPNIDYNYETGVYQYTPVNAGTTTTYDLATLVSNSVLTFTSPSAKWVRGPSGTLVEIAAGQIAIEYDANGAPLGCINTEPARTNSAVRSQEFDNTSWVKTNMTISADSLTAPDGTTTMDSLLESANSLSHQMSQINKTFTAVPYTWSAWVKPIGRQWVRLMTFDGTTLRYAWFDVVNGVVGTFVGATARMSYWPLIGAYRCELTFTPAATAAGVCYINASETDGGADNYAGDITKGYGIWGAQLEAGSYASSYIPTTSGTVTRLADQLRLNLESWFDNSKWIVAAKHHFPRTNATAGSTLTALWELDLATPSANNYAATWLSSTNRIDFLERTASTDGAAGNATTLSFPATVRSAFGWSPSNAKASLNGSTQTLTGTPSTAANQQPFVSIDLSDSQRANVDQGAGYLQAIAIYPIVPTQDNVNQYAGSI